MNQFHSEFVAEAQLFCAAYGAMFFWLIGRYALWPRLKRALARRAPRG